MLLYENVNRQWETLSIKSKLPELSDLCCDLIDHLLVYNPKLRYSSHDSLLHPYVSDFEFSTEQTEYYIVFHLMFYFILSLFIYSDCI